jgi:hypothetical protein
MQQHQQQQQHLHQQSLNSHSSQKFTNNYQNISLYQQPQQLTSNGNYIENHQQQFYEKKCSHNKTDCNKKHVKFAKSSKITTSSGRALKSFKKSKKIPKSSSAGALQQEVEPAYYYYYYYPDDTTSNAPDELQQQQYYYNNNNNMVGNYYYYTLDGTTDANYQPEFFIQQSSINSENYMR